MEIRLKDLSFWDHLEELRNRLIQCLIVFAAASFFAYQFVDPILSFLIRPVGQLVFTNPSEAFLAHVTITLWGGGLISSPILFYHVWAFLSAALHENERRYALIFTPISLVFFLSGIAFAYFAVIPFSLNFLLAFASETMVPMITVGKYFSFVGSMCLGFGVVFEMPLLIVFLVRVGIATPAFLIHMRRYAILLIFIVSAIVTPPDYVSQILMAVPLIILYEISIMCSKVMYRLREQADGKLEPQ